MNYHIENMKTLNEREKNYLSSMTELAIHRSDGTSEYTRYIMGKLKEIDDRMNEHRKCMFEIMEKKDHKVVNEQGSRIFYENQT